MKKISVIIPVYNVEKYLAKCLDSLINQEFSDYEIIVVNDGSPDNSQSIIDSYVEKYPKIVKSYIKENGGQGSARNLGISKAKGEYICFVDSDDFVESNFLNSIYNFALQGKYDVVVFDSYKVFDDGREKQYEKGLVEYSSDIQINYILSLAGPCNKLFKRMLWVDNNLKFMEQTIYEDLAIIPTIAKYTKRIGYMSVPLYNYLIRSSSSMHQLTYSKKMKDIFKVVDNLYKQLNKDYHDELEYLYIIHLVHGAGLRFIKFDEGITDIDKISSTMKELFPNWYNNKYLKKESLKYRIICYLIYKKKIKILKIILK
ncbi:MAG: glycosyltransferase family 2 protein [Bacilli bacterium]